jgi:hypothetical protein
MSSILDQIKARKAAAAAVEAQKPASTVETAPVSTPTTPVTTSVPKPMTLQERILAQKKAIAAKNPSLAAAGLVGGAVVTGNAEDQRLKATELQQAKAVSSVLTAQQQATNSARSLIEQRAAEGFYTIAKAESLPAALPATLIEQHLLEMDAALLGRTPELTTLVVKINQNLRQYEELAYLLNDEQLHLIVESNLAAASVTISSGKATDKSNNARLAQKLDSLSLDDFA